MQLLGIEDGGVTFCDHDGAALHGLFQHSKGSRCGCDDGIDTRYRANRDVHRALFVVSVDIVNADFSADVFDVRILVERFEVSVPK